MKTGPFANIESPRLAVRGRHDDTHANATLRLIVLVSLAAFFAGYVVGVLEAMPS